MPRTKHVRKPKQSQGSLEESDLLVKDFERQAELRILNFEAEAKMIIKSFEKFIDMKVCRLPSEILDMTLSEVLAWQEEEKENCNTVSSSVDDRSLPAPATIKAKGNIKRITTASDDGYVTEGGTTVTKASRISKVNGESTTMRRTRSNSNITKPSKVINGTLETPITRRTRSSSKSNRTKLSEINQTITKGKTKEHTKKSTLKVDKFKTPAPVKSIPSDFGLITPKVKPNTPLNVLRRPRQGEMVISMHGSPLLVSAVVNETSANINVPLRNGNVMSLLPKDGLRMSNIPALDAETMQQLETLKSHIEKVIALN